MKVTYSNDPEQIKEIEEATKKRQKKDAVIEKLQKILIKYNLLLLVYED